MALSHPRFEHGNRLSDELLAKQCEIVGVTGKRRVARRVADGEGEIRVIERLRELREREPVALSKYPEDTAEELLLGNEGRGEVAPRTT